MGLPRLSSETGSIPVTNNPPTCLTARVPAANHNPLHPRCVRIVEVVFCCIFANDGMCSGSAVFYIRALHIFRSRAGKVEMGICVIGSRNLAQILCTGADLSHLHCSTKAVQRQ